MGATIDSTGLVREVIDYHGIPAMRISSASLSLDFLSRAGLHLVRLAITADGANLLQELPDARWETPQGAYYPRGGHRLWASPEAPGWSYAPEEAPIEVELLTYGVRLRQPPEAAAGLLPEIEVTFDPQRPRLTLRHRLQNAGSNPVELAPWAITVLPPGGMAFIPQAAARPETTRLLPERRLIMWPYTRSDDPRLRLGDGWITVDSRPPGRFKIGCLNPQGWLAYLRAQTLFVKRFAPLAEAPFPDFGCNCEVYCDPHGLELETVAPLAVLPPGGFAEHTEIWEIYQENAWPQEINDIILKAGARPGF